MSFLIIFTISFIAFCISALSGGGAGLILIPILSQFLNPAQVPAAITIGTATSSLTRILMFYKNIQWRMVSWIVLSSLPGVAVGAYLLSYLNPIIIELCLSLFLISNLVMIFKKGSKEEFSNKLPNWILIIVGFSIGIISSLIGAVGVLYNRIYFRYGLTNEEVIATRAANEIVIHLIKLGIYTWLGILGLETFKFGALVAISSILATLIVKLFINKIPRKIFVKIGYAAMVVSGLFMLNDAAVNIKAEHDPHITSYFTPEGDLLQMIWDNQHYFLTFKKDEGLNIKKHIEFTRYSPLQRRQLRNMCVQSQRMFIRERFGFHGTDYEIHCLYKNRGITHHKIKWLKAI
ncbi:sulfite exporter TauE/SafE family protein [Parashewanella spongiae]|uniref:Probable membrane transporter protein n=1 Tax=Parashewanella spongiae TaxID=342950 RepID=A0A3A6UGQ1_9GAMM|nr:sulfite exporter TauE/SafE family protein [Parashewanella spongiae]MCL1077698.1 sulfite exporter TauE/SafE family protein [Parashewanella spongiae]RJY18106.1 sulfite exporter TauE/SafE family protein [Parashewanella spongiae]